MRSAELGDARWRDLVAGSGIVFEERGAHDLKGVPGEWDLLLARSMSDRPAIGV